MQSHGVDFIGNHKWYERLTQKDKHERHKIEPLNLFLQRCNKNVWESLRRLWPHAVEQLRKKAYQLRGSFRGNWPSSLLASEMEWPGFCTLQEARDLRPLVTLIDWDGFSSDEGNQNTA